MYSNRKMHPLVCSSEDFAKELMKYCDWFTGVPDSVLKNCLKLLEPYYFSSRENHAVSMSFGALMGAKKPCVLMQNSGLGLTIDVLLGLFRLYERGLFLVVSNRGELDWEEIQHHEWGTLTIPLLKTLDISIVDFEEKGLNGVQQAFHMAYLNNTIVVLLVHRGNLDE